MTIMDLGSLLLLFSDLLIPVLIFCPKIQEGDAFSLRPLK
jgi:hypothetical protein